MAVKLSARQQAQVAVLETFPPKFEQIHRLVEEMASLKVDEATVRRLCRILDEIKAGAASIGAGAIAENAGIMGTLARRSGGTQMRLRGLREGLAGLKINFEGAMRAATTPEKPEEEKPTTSSP
jgi:hypothetical protein